MESTENMSVGTETGRLTTQEVVNFNVFKRGNRSPVLQMWSIGNKHSLVVGAGKKKEGKRQGSHQINAGACSAIIPTRPS